MGCSRILADVNNYATPQPILIMNTFKLFKNLYSGSVFSNEGDPKICTYIDTDLAILPHFAQYELYMAEKNIDGHHEQTDSFYAAIVLDGVEKNYRIHDNVFEEIEPSPSFSETYDFHLESIGCYTDKAKREHIEKLTK